MFIFHLLLTVVLNRCTGILYVVLQRNDCWPIELLTGRIYVFVGSFKTSAELLLREDAVVADNDEDAVFSKLLDEALLPKDFSFFKVVVDFILTLAGVINVVELFE